ncbi:MAG: alpha/beta fold hydrolase [Armatimonadota bacterium]
MNSDKLVLQTVEDALPWTVFFPGWATDHRLFDNLDLPTNRLIPLEPFSPLVCDELAAFIRANGLAPVNIIGWSLGGFIAADFAGRFPELVGRLILCGVRFRYPAEQIEATRRGVLDDRERCLRSFYRQCFLPVQKEDYQRFRDELMPCYLKEMSVERLIASLERLAGVEMNADSLSNHPICLIHGDRDVVAPVDEAIAIAQNAANVQLHVLPNAGHAAFLTAESKGIIQKCLI